MTFVSPLFLWALAAVAIPVIIHLFNFRKYKKVYFSNVRFLKELQQESKSKSRLKELLVLLARCLAIACLALAFSQPVLRDDGLAKQAEGMNAVSIYIDNSFSMDNVSKQGPLIEIARSHAREILTAFGNADRFQIITNDFEGKHQRFHTKEDGLNVIDEVKVSAAVRSLNDVIKRQTDFLASANTSNKRIFILSDGQRSTFNLGEAGGDTLIRTTIIPLKANEVNNVSVDTCWFETPLQQKGFIQKLHAKIVNNGNSTIDVGSAKLFLNGQQVALASFSLEPRDGTEIMFTFENKKAGFNYGSIKIEDYPVTFDDELYFGFNSEMNVNVTLINGRSQKPDNAFSSLFNSDSLFSLRAFPEQALDFGAFKSSDVLILNQLESVSSGMLSELTKFTQQGGVVAIIPALQSDLTSYNKMIRDLGLPEIAELDTLTLRTDKIEYASKFYTGVFEKIEDKINLPLVNKHFRLSRSVRSDFETILSLQNGDAFFGSARINNASVFLFSSPIDERCTNFSKHALFVPTFYRISFSSVKVQPLFYPVSANVVLPLKNDANIGEAPPHILQKNGQADIIPEMRVNNNGLFLHTRGQITAPGFYEIRKGETALQPLAFNYSRKESDLTCYTKDELDELIKKNNLRNVTLLDDSDVEVGNAVRLESQGKKLWKLFIILALSFVIIEVALLRLLK